MIAALLMLAQARAYMPPPSPPPLAFSGPALDVERERYADELRRACMSADGVAKAVAQWADDRATALPLIERQRAVDDAVAAAAYAVPVDAERLGRALQAQAEQRRSDEAVRNTQSVTLLRRLSSADRTIFARRLTYMQPVVPARACLPPR